MKSENGQKMQRLEKHIELAKLNYKMEGNPEIRFAAPIRKKTIEKYGFCNNGCKVCVYYEGFF